MELLLLVLLESKIETQVEPWPVYTFRLGFVGFSDGGQFHRSFCCVSICPMAWCTISMDLSWCLLVDESLKEGPLRGWTR